MTRSREAQQLALELGAASVGGADAAPPEPLDSAILFAPVGTLVPPALAALDRGGTLAIAGIYLTDIPPLDYERDLFEERTLRSVTANTRRDGEEFLAEAARIRVRVSTVPYPMERADEALRDLRDDRVNGAAVLVVTAIGCGPSRPPLTRENGPSERKAPTVPQSIHAKRCLRALGDRSWSFRLGHARRQCDQAVDRLIHYSRSGHR